MKIGLIQSRGIGDIIIALPIAKFFSDQGHQVFWPIDERFMASFQPAANYVNFLPFRFESNLDGFLKHPASILQHHGCERIIPLYSYLAGVKVNNQVLFNSLKFDEYKYAVAGVPFGEKWNLCIKRDNQREQALYDRTVKSPEYVVVHQVGSNFKSALSVPNRYHGLQRIDLSEATDNIFDWLMILERASLLILIDSCFANLVDQMRLSNEKYFLFRSDTKFTPVLKCAWKYYGI